MRKIKFRAWLKPSPLMNSGMIFDNEILSIDFKESKIEIKNICDGHEYDAYFNEVDFMQFTGLKDKKGCEVYEGDIVDISRDEEIPYYYYVKYRWDRFVLARKSSSTEEIDAEGDYTISLAVYIKTSKVVGNIYENKDLLNERV